MKSKDPDGSVFILYQCRTCEEGIMIELDEIYEIGKAAGIEENDKVHLGKEKEAYCRGFADGVNEGWEEARTEFRAPDL